MKEGLLIGISIKNLSLLGVDQVERAIIEEFLWLFLPGARFFFFFVTVDESHPL